MTGTDERAQAADQPEGATAGHADPAAEAQQRLSQALDLHEEGRLAEAEQAYRALLAESPERPDVLNNLGTVLTQLARPEEGLAVFDRVVAALPNEPAAHANRGHALASLGRQSEALAAYDEALGLNPAFAEAHLNRARTLHGLDRADEALAAVQTALRLAPENVEAHCLKALLLGRQTRFQAALTAVDQALALQSDHGAALHLRANLLRALGRYDQALATFRQALALRPGDLSVQGDMGVALREQGALGQAVLCFCSVLATLPHSPVARRQLLLTYEAHVAAVRRRRGAGAGRADTAPGRLILGLGTGRCGLTSLTRLLRQQTADVAVTQERPPALPWEPDYEAFAFQRDCFQTLLGVHRFVGDVASWWLPYLDQVIAAFPDCRIVALQRDRAGTVASFEAVLGFGSDAPNHWSEHDGQVWRRDARDVCYPSDPVADRAVAIGRYWDGYTATLAAWARSRPELIRVVPIEALNQPAEVDQLLRFLGFEPPVLPARMVWNAGTRHEGSGLVDLPPPD